MIRQRLERHQVWLYLTAVLAGLALGGAAADLAAPLEALLWPVLGLLLYATFTQVPLGRLPEAFREGRFMAALLLGNFVLLPPVVAALAALLPDQPAVRLGVLMVLLVPCTDWFLTFTHLGRGDTRRAIAATPVLLLAQLALLPVYLWLLTGRAFLGILQPDRIALAFGTLIVLPLAAAFATERLALRRPRLAVVDRLAWLPVPLLALVVFLIAASQVHIVMGALAGLVPVALVFVAYLVAAALLGVAIGRLLALPAPSARALVFSLGTRNSFVVLPFALALPASYELTVVVVVLQTLIELLGMIAYLWVVPRYLVPDHSPGTSG
jgi:arsenite transporter